MSTLDQLFGGGAWFRTVRTSASGPAGQLPITAEMLLDEPSGHLFGMTQDAGMGWNPADVWRDQFLILSTHGGLRDADGRPIALGYHTGHWEIGLLVRAAAETLRGAGVVPFCRLLLRSVRWPHSRHDRHVRQPAVPQRRRHHDAAARCARCRGDRA